MAGPSNTQLFKGKFKSDEPKTLNCAPMTFVNSKLNTPLVSSENLVKIGGVPTMVAALDAKMVSEQYSADTEWLPLPKFVMMQEAIPFVFSGVCARNSFPS